MNSWDTGNDARDGWRNEDEEVVSEDERRSRAEALAHSERESRSIIEVANEAYISFDTHGVIREWNPESERLLGWTRDESVAHPPVTPSSEVTVGTGSSPSSPHPRQAEAPLVPTRVDGTAMTKDGVELPVEFTLFPLKVNGETRVSVLLHDISARRRLAANRERLLKTEQKTGVELRQARMMPKQPLRRSRRSWPP